jgi:hypothetical protein
MDGIVHMQARRLARLVSLNVFASILLMVYLALVLPLLFILQLAHFALAVLVLKYLRSFAPANPKARWVLVLTFILLLFSFLQLGLASIISGNSSCACSWDRYNWALKIFQALGSAVSLGTAALAVTVSVTVFSSNSDDFQVPNPC